MSLQKFIHPAKVYRLEFPSPWENLVQDEGRSCGFGPRDRNDVGLWISIMPFSADTDRLAEDLPTIMNQALKQAETSELRRDGTLRHYGLKADMLAADQGGHYWIVAGGDVVLFASSQVPPSEKSIWNPLFDELMSSLEITRDEELFARKLAVEVLGMLRERHPDQDFQLDEQGIRGRNQVVYLSNLRRDLRASPDGREEIIKHFVESIGQSAQLDMGHETWDDARPRIVPVLKPRNYMVRGQATEHLHVSEWLANVVICYAIRSQNLFRFVTGWDVDRWEIDAATLHDVAIANLRELEWPNPLEGSRERDGSRLIVVATEDSLASSRLLHPDLHRLFASGLGTPFRAGIPDRNTLVLYSDRKRLRQRIERRLKADHRGSSYPVSPRPFLVTADGIALATV